MEDYNTTFNVSIPVSLKDKLARFANKLEKSMAEVVRIAIEKLIEENRS